jgi:hypothetical protein
MIVTDLEIKVRNREFFFSFIWQDWLVSFPDPTEYMTMKHIVLPNRVKEHKITGVYPIGSYSYAVYIYKDKAYPN